MIPPKCLVSKSQAATHIVHIFWNTCHIMISPMLTQVAPIYFFSHLLAILYAANKEVLFQALAVCKESSVW